MGRKRTITINPNTASTTFAYTGSGGETNTWTIEGPLASVLVDADATFDGTIEIEASHGGTFVGINMSVTGDGIFGVPYPVAEIKVTESGGTTGNAVVSVMEYLE